MKKEEKINMADKIVWFKVIDAINLEYPDFANIELSHEAKSLLMLYEYNAQHMLEYHVPEKQKSLFKHTMKLHKEELINSVMEDYMKWAARINHKTTEKQQPQIKCQISSTTSKSIPTTPIKSTPSLPHPPNQKEYIEELKLLLDQYLNVHTLSKCDLCGEIHIPCTCNLCKLTHSTLNKTYKSGR
jgi:hypothetical protein